MLRSQMLLPVLATVGATASFQVGAALAKGLFPAVGPLGAASLRLVFGTLMLMAIARPWRNWPRKARLLPLFGLGAAVAGAMTFFFLAIERLPLGIAIALQFLGPLCIALAGSRRWIDLVWAILAGAGVWCLAGAEARSVMALDLTGVFFALCAAVCWAGYILFGRVATSMFGMSTAALAIAVAAIVVVPVGVQHAGAALLDVRLLPLALVVAVFSVALPFSLELYAIPRIPPRTFAVFMSFEPMFGVLSGLLILGEQLTMVQLLGITSVMVAAAGSAWSNAEGAGASPSSPPPA